MAPITKVYERRNKGNGNKLFEGVTMSAELVKSSAVRERFVYIKGEKLEIYCWEDSSTSEPELFFSVISYILDKNSFSFFLSSVYL